MVSTQPATKKQSLIFVLENREKFAVKNPIEKFIVLNSRICLQSFLQDWGLIGAYNNYSGWYG